MFPQYPSDISGANYRRSSSHSARSILNRTISSTSPSFHSAVQTASEALLATPRTGGQRLDSPPLSSNSQSPSRRPTPNPVKRTPLKPGTSSRFSSVYTKPYFPLQDVEVSSYIQLLSMAGPNVYSLIWPMFRPWTQISLGMKYSIPRMHL